MKRTILTVIALALGVAGARAQGYVGVSADSTSDAGKAIRILYEPSVSTYAATVTVASTTFTLAGPDVASGGAIDMSNASYDTVTELVAAINALTNSSGNKCFSAARWASLDADSVNATMLAASATALPNNQWEFVGRWDTSAHKSWDICPQWVDENEPWGSVVGGRIARVTAEPGGTGNVTLYVYENGSAIFQKTADSPYYVIPQVLNYAGTNTNTTVNTVSMDVDLGIPMQTDKKYLIRASRATTATTGILGAFTD